MEKRRQGSISMKGLGEKQELFRDGKEWPAGQQEQERVI